MFTQQGKSVRRLLTVATVSFLVIGAMIFTACNDLTGSGGIAEGSRSASPLATYEIYDETDLMAIDDDPSGDYILMNDITLSSGWTPICPVSSTNGPFTGTFDGNGYTITVTGFNSGALSRTDPLGVFAQVGNGTASPVIQNLTVINTTPAISTGTANYVGGIAGRANKASFIGNTIGGTFTVNYTGSSSDGLFVGGVVGYAAGTEGNVVAIGTSKSSATINATSANTKVFAGGLVGNGTYLDIREALNSGAVTVDGPGYNTSAGGIAGYVTNTSIYLSNSSGNISGTALAVNFDWNDSWQIDIGGLVGYQGVGSSVVKCYATGTVQAYAPFPYAGGLVGYNYGYNDFSPPPPAQGSSISRSYATGTVTATAQTGSGDIPYAGGLVGYSSLVDSIIENSYATGDVIASSDGQYVWAGGLIGGNAYNSLVSKCYATGRISVTNGTLSPIYPPDGTNSGASAGGIAGYNYYSFGGTAGTIVQNCAALNTQITATGAGPYLIHRVAGDLGLPFTDSYGNSILPGNLINNIANEKMTLNGNLEAAQYIGSNLLGGKDAAAQPSQADFTALGWDFTTIWVMRVGTGYPVLR